MLHWLGGTGIFSDYKLCSISLSIFIYGCNKKQMNETSTDEQITDKYLCTPSSPFPCYVTLDSTHYYFSAFAQVNECCIHLNITHISNKWLFTE